MLQKPIRVNHLELRNRIVMPPMATRQASQGRPTERQSAFYAARAGAVGLIILEHSHISRDGMAYRTQFSLAEDAVIPAFRKLTEAVHARGAAIFAQLSHAGARSKDSGLPPIGPSAVSLWEGTPAPRPMTAEDLARVKDGFVSAAQRALRAGFDGVEIHAAHGYLLSQFYSPLTNRRSDAYTGQTLTGRTRLHVEILRAVRSAVGSGCPIALRFGACDFMEGGAGPEDIPEASRAFSEAGADLLDISGGLNGYTVEGVTTPGWFAELSAPAKASVSIPVLLTGGIRSAREAEHLLHSHAADLIGVGRAMLKEPDWAERALEAFRN